MKASFDKTYCVSKECKKKCWRHESNWEFDKGENYWFMDKCEKELKENANEL